MGFFKFTAATALLCSEYRGAHLLRQSILKAKIGASAATLRRDTRGAAASIEEEFRREQPRSGVNLKQRSDNYPWHVSARATQHR